MSGYDLGLIGRCDGCQQQVRIRDDLAGRRLHCNHCGGQYVIINPTAAAQAAAPMQQQPAEYHPGYAPVEDTNTIAVVGFVMSLLGVCAAFTTAPIALGCSVVGLRKEPNKGYAIAGTIISSIQLVLIVMAFIQFLVVGRFFWQASGHILEVVDEVKKEAVGKIASARNDQAMDHAVEKIDDRALALGALPTTEEGTELVEFYKDGWNTPFRYRTAEGRLGGYTIESAGPDGQWDTSDDVGRSVPTPVITDVNAAILLLKEDDARRKRLGVDWLLISPPDDLTRSRVVAALTPLARDHQLGAAASRALAIWAKSDEFSDLVRTRVIDIDEITTDPVPGQQPIKPENLLSLINSSDSSVREKARETIRNSSIDQQAIVQQCLADLSHDDVKYNALSYLVELPLDAVPAADVKKQIFAIMRQGDASGNVTHRAMGILNRIGISDEDIPTLAKVYPSCPHEIVFDVLIEHVNEEMINGLLARMDESGATAVRAGTFFERMGPTAESHLWELTRSGDLSGQMNAVAVLAKIGTQKSISHLEPLLKDRSMQSRAQQAIEAIEARSASGE